MERQVKERLVGAAVLMAAAIILIPELLSGPRRDERAAAPPPDHEAPLKTYTIDLKDSRSVESHVAHERAPPPESPAHPPAAVAETQPSVSVDEPASPRVSEATQANPELRPAERAPSPARITESSARPAQAKPVPAASSAPARSAPTTTVSTASLSNVPASRGWVVQVGSFSNRATAERIARELIGQGQKAFVMPVKSGGSTLYRVRIGPFPEREVANDTLRQLKDRAASAAVVAHP